MRQPVIVVAALVSLFTGYVASQGMYSQVADVHIGGPGPAQWDYSFADSAGKRLYVSHSTEVVVIDTATDKVVGRIMDTPGVHGIAVGAGKVFTSNGRENKVSVVDPKTLATLSKIDTGGANPDAITFDAKRNEVWAFNHTGNSATQIDAKTGAVVAVIPLTGVAETGQADGAGKVFVNIEDKDQIDVIDAAAKKVVASWSVAPGTSPTGMALDIPTHRLFVGAGGFMVMMDSTNGKVVAIGADLQRHGRHLVRRRHQARVQLLPRRQDHDRQSRRRHDDRGPDARHVRGVADDEPGCGDAQDLRDRRQAECDRRARLRSRVLPRARVRHEVTHEPAGDASSYTRDPEDDCGRGDVDRRARLTPRRSHKRRRPEDCRCRPRSNARSRPTRRSWPRACSVPSIRPASAVAGERPNPELAYELSKETPRQSITATLPIELGGKRARRLDRRECDRRRRRGRTRARHQRGPQRRAPRVLRGRRGRRARADRRRPPRPGRARAQRGPGARHGRRRAAVGPDAGRTRAGEWRERSVRRAR